MLKWGSKCSGSSGDRLRNSDLLFTPGQLTAPCHVSGIIPPKRTPTPNQLKTNAKSEPTNRAGVTIVEPNSNDTFFSLQRPDLSLAMTGRTIKERNVR